MRYQAARLTASETLKSMAFCNAYGQQRSSWVLHPIMASNAPDFWGDYTCTSETHKSLASSGLSALSIVSQLHDGKNRTGQHGVLQGSRAAVPRLSPLSSIIRSHPPGVYVASHWGAPYLCNCDNPSISLCRRIKVGGNIDNRADEIGRFSSSIRTLRLSSAITCES